MAEPFIAEIRLMSFNFAPKGWAQCNGALLPINQNQPLFALLGTTYGGDGRVNFALPDVRGQVPVHMGSGFVLGQRSGETAIRSRRARCPSITIRLKDRARRGTPTSQQATCSPDPRPITSTALRPLLKR